LAGFASACAGLTRTAIGSAWVGCVLGALVAWVAAGRPAGKTFGSRQSARATVAAVLALVALGLPAAYRPSGVEPPASVAALGLAPDIGFDYPDAGFWEGLLPDGWREAGEHHAYQEAIIDGHGIPLGPAGGARDEPGLARELATMRFALSINGEP